MKDAFMRCVEAIDCEPTIIKKMKTIFKCNHWIIVKCLRGSFRCSKFFGHPGDHVAYDGPRKIYGCNEMTNHAYLKIVEKDDGKIIYEKN